MMAFTNARLVVVTILATLAFSQGDVRGPKGHRRGDAIEFTDPLMAYNVESKGKKGKGKGGSKGSKGSKGCGCDCDCGGDGGGGGGGESPSTAIQSAACGTCLARGGQKSLVPLVFDIVASDCREAYRLFGPERLSWKEDPVGTGSDVIRLRNEGLITDELCVFANAACDDVELRRCVTRANPDYELSLWTASTWEYISYGCVLRGNPPSVIRMNGVTCDKVALSTLPLQDSLGTANGTASLFVQVDPNSVNLLF